ncbi:MAG: SCO family protein [Thermoguttaceae bacterium]
MKLQTLCTITAATLVAACVLEGFPSSANADETPDSKPAILRRVGFDQRLNEQLPLDLTFVDENGKKVKLGDYFGQKPVILVLAYFECQMLCTEVLNGLVRGMREIPFTPGKEFTVLTISFDPREKPPLAAAKKENYLRNYGREGAGPGWHFLTGDPENIAKLTDAVGFRYVYDEKTGQYIHVSGLIILTPQGKISRYLRDTRFPGRDLRLGLVEASAGNIGSPSDDVLLYCFHYDPQTGKYTPTIVNFVRAGGLLTMLAVGLLVWFLARRQRRKRSTPGEAGASHE